MMPHKDPNTYNVLTLLWVVTLSAWGGTVNYIRKLQTGTAKKFSIFQLLGEIVSSSFFGVITFLLCEAGHFSPLVTAALVGLSGHMGSKALYLIMRIWSKRSSIKVSINLDEDKK